MAAGVTVTRDRVPALAAFLADRLGEEIERARADQSLAIDAAITASGARPELLTKLEQAGPFGSGHPEPVFALPAHRLVEVAEVGRGHVRVKLKAGDGALIDGIAFRAAGQPLGQMLARARGENAHIVGHLALDSWNGRDRVQVRILDAAAQAR
jgi:single-stranded-DNA-specific exonuclease